MSAVPKPPDSDAAGSEPPADRESGVSLVPPHAQGSGLVWRIGGLIRTIRPHQWVKNVFVLAPIFFAKDLFDPTLLMLAASAFGVFCLLAGSVYTINDLADAEADRQHPIKRFRPIASGRVSPAAAKIMAVVLVVSALAGAASMSTGFLIVAAAYFAQNIAYSLKLKQYPYVDVGMISLGFVLRVMGGGYGTRIDVSAYLLVCTALLALFLGFGKRRHELAVAARKAGKQRVALQRYSARGLDIALAITAVTTIGTYLAYSLDANTRDFFGSDHLWWTTFFVVAAVLRFLHLVRSRPRAESPTQEMLKDGPFVAAVLLWVMVVIWIVYNLRPAG